MMSQPRHRNRFESDKSQMTKINLNTTIVALMAQLLAGILHAALFLCQYGLERVTILFISSSSSRINYTRVSLNIILFLNTYLSVKEGVINKHTFYIQLIGRLEP